MDLAIFLFLLALICRINSQSDSCSESSLRLVGGSTQYEGSVEVCIGNTWGIVCDDHWDNTDASVVCRQLGYSDEGSEGLDSFFVFGVTLHNFLMDNVHCTGSETRLVDCPHDTNHNCNFFESAGVRCEPVVCTTGEVRLAGSSQEGRGRVEVCENNQWGTVCDDFWSSNDASVVCRQLGFSRFSATALPLAYFGQGSGLILMDDVFCTGSEVRLVDCPHQNVDNCGHFEDASVICNTTLRCEEGAVRLANGQSSLEGRVEICFSETWGTVCSDHFSSVDARVVCRQLGFPVEGAVVATFGEGAGPIYLDNVACSGSEGTLGSCPYDSDASDCTHSQDIGVRCTNTYCNEEGALRLESGGTASGRVEVCRSAQWGTVCDDHWDSLDAGVVCRQLGYSRYNAIAHRRAAFGAGTGLIHLDNVGCEGAEFRLIDCARSSFHNCGHHEDAGVTCNTTLLCENGALRLNSSVERAYHEGRVEMCWNETWGTVCDSGWSSSDAQVACRQLGFSAENPTVYYNAHFGAAPSSTPVLLQLLACSGSESRLVDCPHSGVGQVASSCGHTDDAGVRCRTLVCQPGELRLVGGVSPYEGRVEVCANSEWGTVCDDLWNQVDAEVACRQLGYQHASYAATAYQLAHYGQGTGTILMDNVFCSGSEARLVDCPHVGSESENCGHFEDAGVRCSQCEENSIRLRGGFFPTEGRVEVCLGGGWGTVCDDGWSSADATVVCRQLGFDTQGAMPVYSASFGQGTNLTIAMDGVSCFSSEARLVDCGYLDANNIRLCSHSEDAGVICASAQLGQPASFEISDIQSTSLTLTWTLPAPSERSEVIAGFNANCTANGFAPWTQSVSGNTTLSASVTGLGVFVQYTCCVAARGLSGRVGVARCVAITTLSAVPSGPPTNIIGYPLTSRSIRLQWDPPLQQHLNGVISGYVAVCNGTTSQATGSSVTLSDRSPHSTYSCTVAASNSAGVGAPSAPVEITTFQEVPSGPPSSITLHSITSTSASLSISLPSPELRNGVILSYSILLTELLNSQQTSHVTPDAGGSFVLSSLSPFTMYSYAVAASTVNGTGPYSEVGTFTTSEAAPTGPPRSVQLSPLQPTVLRITWSPVLAQQRNGEVRQYSMRLTHTNIGLQILLNSSSSQIIVYLLHPDYVYTVEVAAFTVALGPYSAVRSIRMPEAAPSAPPSNIILTGTSPTSFTAAWGPVPTASRNGLITGFMVRLTYPGGVAVLRNTTDTQTMFTSLLASTTYSVSVAAKTAAGLGPFSVEQTFTTSLTAPSSAPSQLALTAAGSSILIITWTPPSTPEWNGESRGFKLSMLELESNTYRNLTIQNGATSTYLASQLHPYYSYQCRIAAFNSAGSGPYSQPVTLRLPQDVPSAPPTDITSSIQSPRQFTLSWSPPPLASRNGPITHYLLQLTTAAQGTTVLNITGSNLQLPSPGFSAVSPATVYIVQLAAGTIVGQGPYSTDVVVQTPEDNPTHFPENLTEEVLNSTSFRLRWDPPPPEHHNGVIREYRINVTDLQTGEVLSFSTPHTELVVGGLHPYYLYECAVSAVTVAEGPYSAPIAVRTHEAAPSAAPHNISTTHVSSSSVSLAWSAPPETSHNGLVRHYSVFLTDLTTSTQSTVDTIGSTGSITVSSLEPFRGYSVRVAAYTVALGPLSSPLQFTTLEDVPGSPRGFTLTASSPTSLQASWMPPENESLNGVIISYQLVLRELRSGVETSHSTSASTTSYMWSGLHPHYSYSVSVAAATVAGNGPTVESQIQMPEAAPSGIPLEIVITNISPTSASVSWAPPLFEQRNGVIRRYRLRLVEMETGNVWGRNATATHFLFDFLEESFQYRLSIAADTVAVGTYSDPVEFSTLPDRPSDGPLDLMVTTTSPFSVSATWSPPNLLDRNGQITQYIVNITHTSGDETYQFTTPETSHMTGTILHPDYVYQVSVAAENSVGRGPSSTFIVRMPEAAPSGPPLNFTASPLDPRTLELTWSPPASDRRNGLVRGYRLIVLSQLDGTVELNTTTVGQRLMVADLHPDYTYMCSVSAFTVGLGPAATSTVQLLEDTPAIAPPDFTATYNITRPTSVTLTWRPLPPTHHNGELLGYILTSVPADGSEQPRETTVGAALMTFELTGLRPDTEYNFTIAAYTVVGRGPVAVGQVTLLPRVPTHAPALGEIVRLSATEIQIRWSGGVATEGLTYLVKYRPVFHSRVQRRNTDNLATIVETNQTDFLLTELDPRFVYAVSVAARNRAGAGNFSEEVTVGLYDSSNFVVHFSGAIVCVPWLTHDSEIKLSLILNTLVTRLVDACSCRVSAKYIAQGNLSCGDQTTDRVILHGALVGTEGSNSSTLHAHLQGWVDARPTVEIRGIPLSVVPCSTYPGGEDSCSLRTFQPTEPVVGTEGQAAGGFGGVTLYAAIAGGVALLLLVIVVILVVVGCVRKRRKKKYRLAMMNSNMPLDSPSSAHNPLSINNGDVKMKESKLDDVKFDFDDSEHIYDDPNLFTSIGAQGQPNGNSTGRNAAVEKLRALDYTTPVPKLQPAGASATAATHDQKSGAAARPQAQKKGTPFSNDRYTNLPGYATPRTQSSSSSAVPPPGPPPGHSVPRTSTVLETPAAATTPAPPNTSIPKRSGYAVPRPQDTTTQKEPDVKAVASRVPDSAVPGPEGVSQKQEGVKKEPGPAEQKEMVGYFSLLQVNRKEEGGAYQELSTVQTNQQNGSTVGNGSTLGPGPGEDDQYVVMKSSKLRAL